MISLHKEIVLVSADRIKCNPFNSNEVTIEEQEKITDDIRTNGFFGGILVRPLSTGDFEIIDGEHRYIALKSLGLTEIPCIIKEQDDKEARINCIRLNTERGNQNPRKVGQIVKELEQLGMSLSDSSSQLVYSESILEDMKALSELPEDANEIIKEMEEQERQDSFMVWSFLTPTKYNSYIEEAVEKFGDNRGEAFGELCKRLVEESSDVE